MAATPSGNYPIESREGEIERLHIQGAAMEPDTVRMLELIGVAPGWHCLDIGCGPGGITGPMVDYLPSTVESLRGTTLGHNLTTEPQLTADLAACRAHLRNPDTVFTMFTVAQVWGRTPG